MTIEDKVDLIFTYGEYITNSLDDMQLVLIEGYKQGYVLTYERLDADFYRVVRKTGL